MDAFNQYNYILILDIRTALSIDDPSPDQQTFNFPNKTLVLSITIN